MDAWGIGYEQLKEINPRLIFASITPMTFGAQERFAMPDYDSIMQADQDSVCNRGDSAEGKNA